MFKTVLLSLFLLFAASPLFAAIEVRDTTPLNQCDTLIDNNGVASPVKIKSVSRFSVTYTQCSDVAKKIYTLETSKVQDIKSKTFTLQKPKPISLIKRANTLFTTSMLSILTFLLSARIILSGFEGDSGNESKLLIVVFFAFIISPIVILISFISSINLWKKARKAGDKKASSLAKSSFFFTLLTILLTLVLVFRYINL
jgi:hypothetical protein